MGEARPKTGPPPAFPAGLRWIAAIAAALLAAACTGTTQPDAPSTTTASANTGRDTADSRAGAKEMCSAFALAALSGDTTVDRGPADARKRAATQYGTPQLAEQLSGEGRDNEWTTLAGRGARILVDTRPIGDDPPPIRADRAAAGVVASRVAVADDSSRQDLTATAVYCTVIRTAAGWRVADVAFSDAPSTNGAGDAP